MADEIAKLVLSVDSSSAKAAAADLDKLTASSEQLTAASQRWMGSSRGMVDTLKNLNEQAAAGSAHAQKSIREINAQSAAFEEERKAVKALAAGQKAAEKAAEGHAKGLSYLSFSSGGAAREYGVLINEFNRGDMTRLEGSFITLANRVGLMPLIFTATGAAVVATIAVIGAFAVAAGKGALEQINYNKALIATGNYAQTTYGEIENMARGVNGSIATIGKASEAFLALAESGRFTREEIPKIGNTILEMSRVGGQSVQDLVKEFEKLKDSPVSAAMELDKTMHFLTTSTLLAAKAAMDHGDAEKAFALIADDLQRSAASRAQEEVKNIGYMQSAWEKLKGIASSAWHAMADIGKNQDLAMQQASGAAALMQARYRLVENTKNMGNFLGPTPERITQEARYLGTLTDAQNKLNAQMADVRGVEAQKSAREAHTHAVNEAAVALDNQRLATDRAYKRETEVAKSAHFFALMRSSDDKEVANSAKYSVEAEKAAAHQIELSYKNRTEAHHKMSQAEKDAHKEQNAHNQQLKTLDQTLEEHEALLKQNQQTTDKLTESDRWGARQLAILKDEYTHLTKAEIANYEARIRAVVAGEAVERQKDREIKTAEDYLRINDQINKQGLTRAAQTEKELQQLSHSAAYIEYQNRLTQVQIDLQVALDKVHTDAVKNNTAGGESEKREIEAVTQVYKNQTQAVIAGEAAKKAAMGDWRNGARRAWEEFAEKSNDVAGQTYDGFKSAFSGMESALDNFARTGKFKFADFARSVLAELAKIELRIILSKILTSIFGEATSGSGGDWSGGASMGDSGGVGYGGTSGTGPYANGGAFMAGVQVFANGGIVNRPTMFPMANGMGLMGEAGPEAVMPLSRMPNGKLGVVAAGAGGGAGPVTVQTTVVVNGDGGSKKGQTTASDEDNKQAKILGEFLSSKIKEHLVQEQRQGGILWRMNNG